MPSKTPWNMFVPIDNTSFLADINVVQEAVATNRHERTGPATKKE